MKLTKFSENVSNITNLNDKPSIEAQELKRLFDKGNEDIKNYLNNVLIPELEDGTGSIINDLVTGGTDKSLSAEMGKELQKNKQDVIAYGTTVPELPEGKIFVQIFD